jgi:hypothetical protein
MRLATLNKRDLYGLIGWFIAGIAVGLFALPIMVAREYYQYKHYKLARFEWEDIIRYSFVIIVGSVICFLLWQ